MPATHYLGCDLGAESGRLMLGTLDRGRLALREVHRFATGGIKRAGSLVWDMPRFFQELELGLRRAAESGLQLQSVSTDSWGLDYILFDSQGAILEPAYHYRDARTAKGVARVQACVQPEVVFAETGVQFIPINTLYQLAAESPERLARAAQLLLVGDAFNFHLSGQARTEVSLASTTQLYNPRTQTWSLRLLKALEFPERLFAPLTPSGTRLGPLRTALGKVAGLEGLEVVAGCSHDTGAAVAAVPAEEGTWAYISSGTWSLMGVERPDPVMSQACQALNFTNEIGWAGTVRLLKNIIGLWLVQECRRQWSAEGTTMDYGTLTQRAAEAPTFVSLIDPADARFVSPPSMPAEIAAYCRETGQSVPSGVGPIIRCALESLALLYRHTLRQLEQLTGQTIDRIHIVGGGCQNNLLNQLTADACGVPVLAGPVEATVAGNILIQAMTLGHLPSWGKARQVIRESFPCTRFEPGPSADWDRAFHRFEHLSQRRGDPA